MSIDITPPPAVVEFAKKSGYEHGVKFIREIDDYKIFAPDYSYLEDETFGLPNFIIVKDEQIRWNTPDEQEKIMYIINKKK